MSIAYKIGYHVHRQHEIWQELITGSQVCIVTDETVAALYLSDLQPLLQHYQCSTVTLPQGDSHKTLDSWLSIIDTLVRDQHYRTTTVIALGGGVVGDTAGFAAACYQRGVSLIQVPTTLLAQVDAAIGGKTGINYQDIKNLLGVFYNPKAVIIDSCFLSTLPEREFRAGLAEVIKYGLIADAAFLDYLTQHVQAILSREPSALTYIVAHCGAIKQAIVAQDMLDTQDVRARLNFGHTFAHALESVMQYTLLHGEAVAWGMRQACALSQRLGYLSASEVLRVEQLLQCYGLPIELPTGVTTCALLAWMRKDKKNTSAHMTFVVLERLGCAKIRHDVQVMAHDAETFDYTVP